MSIDIIIYAVIAVVLLNRLWAVLGQKEDDQKPPPQNPFAPRPSQDEKSSADLGVTAPALPMGPVLRATVAPESLAGGLDQIKRLDQRFDEKEFLRGARSAFSMIVEEFGRGDLGASARLLGPQVSNNFRAAIEARRSAGQVLECRVARIRDVEILAAKATGTVVYLTIRFISEQENVLRNAAGEVMAGTPGQLEEITDVWVFSRDTSSADPNWQLVETKVED